MINNLNNLRFRLWIYIFNNINFILLCL